MQNFTRDDITNCTVRTVVSSRGLLHVIPPLPPDSDMKFFRYRNIRYVGP